jgi:hypothetical protein
MLVGAASALAAPTPATPHAQAKAQAIRTGQSRGCRLGRQVLGGVNMRPIPQLGTTNAMISV